MVIAGRAFDAAITAAYPIMRGLDPGLAYHMGKIVECGSLVATPRAHDGVLAEMHDDCFIVEPADPDKRCTVELVAAHTLYEKSNPYLLGAPGGVLDLRECRFEQVDERRVRVSGSRWVPDSTYRIKLEGAARRGARAVCLAGVRDPGVVANLPAILRSVEAKVHRDLDDTIDPSTYRLIFRTYGVDAVMGAWEPSPPVRPQELALLIEVVAPSQTQANTVCSLARSATLHAGFEGRKSTGGNLAFPFSPAEFAGPEAYEFSIYHLMEVDDPEAPFPIDWVDVSF